MLPEAKRSVLLPALYVSFHALRSFSSQTYELSWSQILLIVADASAVLATEGVQEGSSTASSPTKASEASTRFQAASFNLARPPDDIVRPLVPALSAHFGHEHDLMRMSS